MLIILLGLGLGSVIGGFARRGSPGNFALTASCLLAGVVGLTTMWVAFEVGSVLIFLLVPLGLAYLLHPLAIQAMCGTSKTKLPYVISIAISTYWVYLLFFNGG